MAHEVFINCAEQSLNTVILPHFIFSAGKCVEDPTTMPVTLRWCHFSSMQTSHNGDLTMGLSESSRWLKVNLRRNAWSKSIVNLLYRCWDIWLKNPVGCSKKRIHTLNQWHCNLWRLTTGNYLLWNRTTALLSTRIWHSSTYLNQDVIALLFKL